MWSKDALGSGQGPDAGVLLCRKAKDIEKSSQLILTGLALMYTKAFISTQASQSIVTNVIA